MKKHFFALILVLAIVLTSCSDGAVFEDGKQGSNSRDLVKVYFYPEESRGLHADYTGYDLVYLLTATPNFARGGRTIVGTVSREEFAPDNQNSFVAGYFEKGEWTFKVEAALKTGVNTYFVLADDEKEKELISSDTATVAFDLVDKSTEGDKGNVLISVKVPRLSLPGDESTYGVTLKVKVDGGTATDFTKPTPSSDDEGTDLLLFTGKLEDLDGGCHSIEFEYLLGGTSISKEIVEVRVVNGVESTVSGTMLGGKYAKSTITVSYATEAWSMELSSDATNDTVLKNVDATVTCSVTNGGSSIAYDWFVDGSPITVDKDKTSTKFKSSAPGVFSVTCVVTIGNVSKSETMYIYVNDK